MFGLLKMFSKVSLWIVPALLFSASETVAQSDAPDAEVWSRLMPVQVLDAISVSNEIQIIDIRSKKYAKKGTIPGSVWMTYKDWRGPKDRPGQPQSETDMASLIGGAGLRLDKPIVIFNHSGHTMQNGQAAFVYWMLKTAGSDQVSILSGGFKAWKAADLEIAEAHIERDPQTLEVAYRRDWWAGPMEIYAVATEQMDGAILDARFEKQVQKAITKGTTLQSMPLARYFPVGLIAQNIDHDRMSVAKKNAFRSALQERGINLSGDLLISICQTGELSALSWFYASEIVQIENVQYYPDALQGWKADGGALFGLVTDGLTKS